MCQNNSTPYKMSYDSCPDKVGQRKVVACMAVEYKDAYKQLIIVYKFLPIIIVPHLLHGLYLFLGSLQNSGEHVGGHSEKLHTHSYII